MSRIVVETERLLLRELTDDDHRELHAILQNPRVNRFVGGPPPPLDEYVRASRERWEAHRAEHGFCMWAALRRGDGVLLGRCGPVVQRIDGESEVEVGYMFAEEHWGRGYAAEAARATRDWAFRTLDVPHVISLILPENGPSVRVAERNGMSVWKMADFREHRVRVYRVTREEWGRERGQVTGDRG